MFSNYAPTAHILDQSNRLTMAAIPSFDLPEKKRRCLSKSDKRQKWSISDSVSSSDTSLIWTFSNRVPAEVAEKAHELVPKRTLLEGCLR